MENPVGQRHRLPHHPATSRLNRAASPCPPRHPRPDPRTATTRKSWYRPADHACPRATLGRISEQPRQRKHENRPSTVSGLELLTQPRKEPPRAPRHPRLGSRRPTTVGLESGERPPGPPSPGVSRRHGRTGAGSKHQDALGSWQKSSPLTPNNHSRHQQLNRYHPRSSRPATHADGPADVWAVRASSGSPSALESTPSQPGLVEMRTVAGPSAECELPQANQYQ
jgi:hypothetical protein